MKNLKTKLIRSRAAAEAPPAHLLDQVRKASSVDAAAAILDDAEAIKVVVAMRSSVGDGHWWVHPRVELKAPGGYTTASTLAIWNWLVQGWKFDVEQLGAVAGLSADTVEAKLAVLVGNRLVYPDGSPSNGAALAVQAYVGKKLGVKKDRRPAPAAAPKEES